VEVFYAYYLGMEAKFLDIRWLLFNTKEKQPWPYDIGVKRTQERK
jgi:hypothetical protein